jgi:hypothetical protein
VEFIGWASKVILNKRKLSTAILSSPSIFHVVPYACLDKVAEGRNLNITLRLCESLCVYSVLNADTLSFISTQIASLWLSIFQVWAGRNSIRDVFDFSFHQLMTSLGLRILLGEKLVHSLQADNHFEPFMHLFSAPSIIALAKTHLSQSATLHRAQYCPHTT